MPIVLLFTNNRKTIGTIDFWDFLSTFKNYHHFRNTDQIWWYYHHFSSFYGWFFLIWNILRLYRIYPISEDVFRLNCYIFQTDSRATLKFYRNTSNRLLWKVLKFHRVSHYRFWVTQNQIIGGTFCPPPWWVGLKESQPIEGT